MQKPDPFAEAVKAVEMARKKYQQRVEEIKQELVVDRQERTQRGR